MTDASLAARRADVLARALERRPAGQPTVEVEPCSALDAFAGAVDELHALLTALAEHDWSAPAHGEIGTVAELVVHLVGVERLVAQWVEADPDEPPTVTEHLSATRAAAEDVAGIHPRFATELWAEAARRAIASCAAADPTKPILAHDLPTDVDGLLVLRAFEVWSHLLDVCRATGRPVPTVDERRLALMSSRLMGAVPLAAAWRGVEVPDGVVRFVLTGDAPRCYDVAFGDSADAGTGREPGTTIVADTTDVCRIATGRSTPRDVDVVIEGDEAIATAILGALDAFARD